jgi:hypothetical protein
VSRNKVIVFIAVIWAFSVLIGIFGFYKSWGFLPGLIEVILSITLLAPYALPQSFGDILGITNIFSTRGTLKMVVVYWPVLIGLHWFAYKLKSHALVLILGIVILFSSYKWFVVGAGMMGI